VTLRDNARRSCLFDTDSAHPLDVPWRRAMSLAMSESHVR
jgi:hypothetical protein